MKGRGEKSPEPQCLMVGRKGRTREAAQAAGWGQMWQCSFFFAPTHVQLSCGTGCCRMPGQTEVSVLQCASVLGRRVCPGEQMTHPIA